VIGVGAARAAGKKPSAVKTVNLTEFKEVMSAARAKPGTKALFINVWATWCEPCREEMPDIVRFVKDGKHKNVRVLLVSADSTKERAEVVKYLTSLGVDFPSYHKTGDDMEFINGIDPAWDGTIPASWLFDADGKRVHLWNGSLTYDQLVQKVETLFPTAASAPSGSKSPSNPTPKRKP
jgi:thiol-disulfide isomerase/thioredoxin